VGKKRGKRRVPAHNEGSSDHKGKHIINRSSTTDRLADLFEENGRAVSNEDGGKREHGPLQTRCAPEKKEGRNTSIRQHLRLVHRGRTGASPGG